MPDPLRRVVVTGVGAITPLGNSPKSLWDALRSGRSGIARLTSLPTEPLPCCFGGEARDFTGHIDDFGPLEGSQKKSIRKGLKLMCREIQMGVAAAQLALANAGLRLGDYDCERTGVVYGSDYIMSRPEEFAEGVRSCLDANGQFQFDRWSQQGLAKVTPLWLLKYLPNMPASHIAIYNDLRGPNNSITLREASPNLALAEAYCTIRRGSADRIVVGATGTRLHPLRTVHVILQEEVATGSDDPTKLARPFDADRTGLVLGEGAGALIVEELAVAESRGAKILGEIIGYGSSTVQERNGLARGDLATENVLKQSLQRGALGVEQVGHIHAHGLGTRKSDAEEAQAIARIFSSRRQPVPVTAAKSYFGNLGAAAGMVEIIGSLMALKHDELFRTLNYEKPDPDCPIRVVRETTAPGDTFINLNLSPQGQASAIVMRRL